MTARPLVVRWLAQHHPGEIGEIYGQQRGSPKNAGQGLIAVHLVVRMISATGWKSISVIGPFPKYRWVARKAIEH